MTEGTPLAAVIGIDWADQHHDVALQEHAGARVERTRLPHTPEAIRAWIAALRARFGNRPVGIAVETSRGPLIHALLDHANVVLYPVNPRSLKRFRETFAPSGAKDDLPDADLLRELLAKHRDRLRPWVPDAEEVRALRRFTENRRRMVDLRTQLTLQLTTALKDYYPQALTWAGADLSAPLACDFLRKWPTLAAVQRARPDQLRAFYVTHNCRRPSVIARRLAEIQHAVPLTRDPAIIEPAVLLVQLLVRQLKTLAGRLEGFDTEIEQRFAAQADADLFRALPGSGPALAPRLLVAFGTERARFPHPADVQQFSGIAPVLERSGNSRIVHWRTSAPTFIRQTFHEFANQSIRYSAWANAYYALQRSRGKSHHTAVRALAFKWIRIIWSCWRERTQYDEARYTRALRQRGALLATRLPIGDTVAAA
jgi:transposase